MTDKYIFIADVFAKDVPGGGELNNDEFIKLLQSRGKEVKTIESHLVTHEYVKQHKEYKFIVANFINLSELAKDALKKCSYAIYEHDHKYLKNRNPGVYHDYLAPDSELVNVDFYRKARAVLCQSNFHKNIVDKNLDFTAKTVTLSGNLWSEDTLEFMRKMSHVSKEEKYAVMFSNIGHKNTQFSIDYCNAKKYKYEIIFSKPHIKFLEELGKYKSLVFFPKTPETLSRIAVEARMMNMGVISNKNLGASYEPWFELKGETLIEQVKEMRTNIVNKIIGVFDE